MKMTPWTNCR